MAPWSEEAALGSGLADRYQLTVQEAYVGTPFPNQTTRTAVVLNGERNIDGAIDDSHLWMTVGKFEAGDKDGTFLVHEEQSPKVFDERNEPIKKISKNSGYGQFLASALEVGGDMLEANQSPDRNKYEIWDLSFWVGLTLDIEEIEEKFTYKEGHAKAGQEGTSRQPVVRGISKGDGAVSTVGAAAAAPASNGAGDYSAPSFIEWLEGHVAAGGQSSGADVDAARAHYAAAKS